MPILVDPCLLFLTTWVHHSALAVIGSFAKILRQFIDDFQALVVGGIIGEMLAWHTIRSRVRSAWCLDQSFSFRTK